jgi:uncharacterized protein (DUF2461 family)
MKYQKIIDCLKDLYERGWDEGIGYADDLEFGCSKDARSHKKNKAQHIQNSFRDLVDILQDYLEELSDNMACEIQTEYFRGVEMSYASLIKQFQIWKQMDIKSELKE